MNLTAIFKHPKPQPYAARYEGVLGTSLELHILAQPNRAARQAETQILLEIDRLEGLFSRFLPGSELNRWQSAGAARVSPELAWLLREAEIWQKRTRGAFHPAAEAVQALYRHTSTPSAEDLEALRASLQAPLWELEAEQARKLTSLPLNFNALAKGRIADLACEQALRVAGVQEVWVNLGGDLRHCGAGGLRVAITHPFSPADNAPPLARLTIHNQGVATSGYTQRGLHLFDPRTLRPVTRIAQATALALDAATADVLATAFCVLEPEESLALAEEYRVGCLVVDSQGKVFSNPLFNEQCT
ncbi:FAD:protein FMN transferase [Calidithermus roseus]|uniref:FAD:protein FMN transferase n=1 Tax=Calidithermus roseus TaxID=1644118 RepID=A0A399EVN5_9DEIN|nr:FAD:protein FMN transferase [Calidithermus roseus]RIH87670.1 FAD:protein FMN transferase [Calidithermus roseus]